MRRARGFTMVELIAVMVLMGIIAAVAIPKLVGDSAIAASAFGNQVISAVRYASKSAIAHRRLVCLSSTSSEVKLKIATAAGAASCDSDLPGPTSDPYATTDSAVSASTTLAMPLNFQPDGTITTSAGTVVSGTIKINAQSTLIRTITIEGATGYVD